MYGSDQEDKKIHLFKEYIKIKTGDRIYVEITLTPILNEDEVCTHIVALAKDITTQRLIEIEKMKSQSQLAATESEYRSLLLR